MQNRQESLDVASPGQLWFPSLDSASSDSCIVFRKSAYRLRMAVPNVSIGALLWGLQCSAPCCVVSTNPTGWTPLFFFVASITLTLFEKPKQQNQEKCRGGYFRRDNRDQLVPGFQTGPISTLTGAEWPCARSVLAIITSVSSEDKLAKSKRNTRKHRRQSTRKKTSWHDGYVPRHARCRVTTRLTQNNSVTVMQTMRRNPSMQNRTILIQCDRALKSVFDENKNKIWRVFFFKETSTFFLLKKRGKFYCIIFLNGLLVLFQSHRARTHAH